jgi:hypothetical protein
VGNLDVIFAWIVGVLAGLAVIGALAFAITWEVCAIKRTLAAHRAMAANRPPTDEDFWRQQRALIVPGRRQ